MTEFSQQFLKSQKERLLNLREDILNKISEKGNEDFQVKSDEVIEEGDQAQAYIDQNVTFGLRERELHRLREIEAALQRIEDGNYGICEENDEPIGQKRLEKMPWTRLSIQAAEAIERERNQINKR